MRIQETDRILKESRYARQQVNHQPQGGMLTKAWRMISNLFKK